MIADEIQVAAAVKKEKQLLGGMLRFDTPEIEDAFKRVADCDFTLDAHAAIYRGLTRQRMNGGIDLPLLASKLQPSPEFTGDSAKGYLLELAEEIATAYHVPELVDDIISGRETRQVQEMIKSWSMLALNSNAKEVRNAIAADLWEFDRAKYGEARYQGIEAADLANGDYTLRYLLDGILVEGQPAFIGGPKKGLKTAIAMALAIAITSCDTFLNKFRVNAKRRVVFLSGESGLATLQETALRICKSMAIELEEVEGLTICTTLPRLFDASDVAECQQFIRETEAEVVIFDPLYLMLTGDDAGNLFKQGALMRNASEACLSIGATPIFCHHTKSTLADPFQPAELDHLAWSGCAEFARQWLLVSRREAYELGSGVHRLWLTAGGSAGHNSLWAVDADEGHRDDPGGRRWDLTVNKADEAREAAQERKASAKATAAQSELEADREKVCRLLAKYPNGASKTFIRDHCGVSSRRWLATFAAMFDDEELVPCEIKVSNQKTPRAGYKLNTDTT